MRVLPVLLLRLSLLVAIAASATLVVDYANAGDPAFCGVMSGCFAVRISPYSRPFGVPLPSLGLAAYALLFGLHFVARKRIQHSAHAALASLGALIACGLLWLQKNEIGAFCQWCVAVDLSAIIAAISSLWIALRARKDEASVLLPQEGRVIGAWTLATLASVVAPFVWGQYPVEPPLPQPIQAEQVPDKLTIVGFTDFECPFCRKMHPVLHDVVERSGGRIRLVRKMNPLSSHLGAEPAALAYLSAPPAKREELADKLYTSPTEELTKEGTLKLAMQVGIDHAAMLECVGSKSAQDKLAADKKLFDDLGGRGLPFTFVGKRVVLGFNPERVEAAVAQSLAGERMSLPVWAMFLLLAVVYVAAVVFTLVSVKDATRNAKEPSST